MFNFKSSVVMIGLLITQVVHAQGGIVVIPMLGDNVSIAQQHFRYSESAGGSFEPQVIMCTSDEFSTPDQKTQVLLLANGSGRILTGSDPWAVKIQFRRDPGEWESISSIASYGTAPVLTLSNISTTDILDLEPNSNYQFRVELISTGSIFTESYCELVVSVSYKLPEGKNILELTP